MNVGIHFSNWYWQPPTEDMYRRLFLTRPDTIKTCLFYNPRFDQVAVHRRLRAEHPGATIIARLFADMTGGAWSPDEFVTRFVPRMHEIMPYTQWFEVHNEPDIEIDIAGYTEGWGRSSYDAEAFNVWAATVIVALRNAVPGCKLVFPGQWVHPGFAEWWRRVIPAIRMCDAWGIHCYWQHGNVLSRDWGACYQIAHEMLPSMPLYVTEFGDSTPGRTPAEKTQQYRTWYQALPAYVRGSALYILGGTQDWHHFEVTDDMARAIGEIPRQTTPPPVPPPAKEVNMFKLARPLAAGVGRVSQWFGDNPEMYEQFGLAGHNGIDYAIPIGTPVYAAHNGVARTGNDRNGYGVWVRVIEQGLRETIYAHLSATAVRDGEIVKTGTQVGVSGNTGFSTGPHLHFGLKWANGRNPAYLGWADPIPFRV